MKLRYLIRIMSGPCCPTCGLQSQRIVIPRVERLNYKYDKQESLVSLLDDTTEMSVKNISFHRLKNIPRNIRSFICVYKEVSFCKESEEHRVFIAEMTNDRYAFFHFTLDEDKNEPINKYFCKIVGYDTYEELILNMTEDEYGTYMHYTKTIP